MKALFLTEAGAEEYDTQGWDFDTGAPENGPLCREVGGTWHIVMADYPKVIFNGEADRRAHVVDAVLPLLEGETAATFDDPVAAMNERFTAVVLVDDENIMLLTGISVDLKTVAIAGDKMHLGNMIVHFDDAFEVAR